MLKSKYAKLVSSLKHRKYREKERKFLIEGFHLIEECLRSSYVIERVMLRKDVDLSHHGGTYEIVEKKKIPVEFVPPGMFRKFSDTVNSQGIIGVVNQPIRKASFPGGDLVVVLDNISDPGNLGTIMRTAYWFGVQTLMLSGQSVDPFNSKVIRSSQGALFHVDLINSASLSSGLHALNENGFEVVLFVPDSADFLEDIRARGKYAAVFGNESSGISQELLATDFRKISIRGYSDCESLNVSIASGIVLNHLRTFRSN